MRFLFLLLAFLVIVALIGVGGGIAYGNSLIALICVFAVIIFMWLGFFIKSKQQQARDDH
jgi:hypothetical protein